ncbi:MAG: NAD-dependent epimerase/dehydratase family protein [Clostridia bacterium]|nr:NAD-dependent epimerase/dehydratase family protein [Clostridia bacterium]
MIAKRDIDIVLSSLADWSLFKEKYVLVTGASGRLGIYIAQALLAADKRFGLNAHVLLLARSKEKLKDHYGDALELQNVHILLQDVTEPIRTDLPVDYIFHTAGLASPSDFTYRPIDTLWGHVQGTKNVLDLAALKETKRVLYVSTVEIYGTWKSEESIKETDMGPLEHTNYRACYPEAKRLCETMLACYKYEKQVDYVGVRMSHTLGPGISINDGRAFAEFLRKALKGEDIILQSDGSSMRTYTYTADAVGAMFLVLAKGTDDYYNVANVDNLISIRDLAALIASLSEGKKSTVIFAGDQQSKLAYLPFKLGVLDSSRLLALGWKPQVDVETMFKWTFDSLK